MKPGIYDALLEALDRTDASARDVRPVDEADQPEVLARHVRDAVLRVLGSTRDQSKRVALVNDLLERLASHDDAVPAGEPQQLLALHSPAGPGVTPYGDVRPTTPLSEAALLTNAHGEPALGPELRAEIDTSDVVDLICAFVKWYGLRLLEPELRRLRLREAPFRVITTTYLGATDRLALDRLVNDFGAEVNVQYDVLRTRLHAKAWPARAHASQPAIIPVLADGVPSRSTVFGPDVISSYGPAQMVAQLAAPNAQYLHLIADDGVAEHLVVQGDDSYAVFTGEPGNWAVRQGGPEQLWDKVEDALAKWHTSGEPNLDTFQITVTPDRQVIDVAGWTGVLPTLDLRYPDKDGQ